MEGTLGRAKARHVAMATQPVGDLLREWRQRRRMSQLDLALEAEISTRHLSFLETGRAQPRREMLLHLTEQLEVPLRERNFLLVAAGFAPVFPERRLEDPALAVGAPGGRPRPCRPRALPGLAVDRHWTLVAANGASRRCMASADRRCCSRPSTCCGSACTPQGLAPRIANLAEWRAHLLARLRRQIEATADPVLAELMRELARLSVAARAPRGRPRRAEYAGVVVPLQLITEAGMLSFFSTTTVFGTPVDITLSELALEPSSPPTPPPPTPFAGSPPRPKSVPASS